MNKELYDKLDAAWRNFEFHDRSKTIVNLSEKELGELMAALHNEEALMDICQTKSQRDEEASTIMSNYEKRIDELESQVEDYSTKAGTYKFKSEEYLKALDKASHDMFLEESKSYKLKKGLDKACEELAKTVYSPDISLYAHKFTKDEWKEWCLKDD